MKLSVIIVNYNVRHFLSKCLDSIFASSMDETDYEVIVVDNCSVDGSKEYFPVRYPKVSYIYNEENVGFGRANNQGIELAKGRYCLILNPDTLLSTETLDYCYGFAVKQQDFGALGVKMVDGKGDYLPESKRNLPTLWNSFCKFSGLYRMGLKTDWLNGYYAGATEVRHPAEVPVLCGAFMFCDTKLLQSINGFDPDYFMYGEDIDLSKRITEAGATIWYSEETQIVHFKGESTKRASIDYLKSFYGSMLIYARKHVKGPLRNLTLLGINVAVILLGLGRWVWESVKALVKPVLHFVASYLLFDALKRGWATFYFEDSSYYSAANTEVTFAICAAVIVAVSYYLGAYEERFGIKKFLVTLPVVLLMSLAIYAILPYDLRSSRMIVVIGTLASILLYYLVDKLLLSQGSQQSVATALVTSGARRAELEVPLSEQYGGDFVGSFACDDNSDLHFIGRVDSLATRCKDLKIKQLVFDEKAIDNHAMIKVMQDISNVRFMLWSGSGDALSISDKTRQSKLYQIGISKNLDRPVYQRIKRTFDILFGLSLVMILPVALMSKRLRLLLNDVISVLIGRKTWVGIEDSRMTKQGVVNFDESYFADKVVPIEVRDQSASAWYHRYYQPTIDLIYLFTFDTEAQ